jgi:DNA-binding MarR family transcriptional regulator
VDRLIAHGLVERREHPDDQRSRLIVLLPEGRRRVDAAMRELVRAEARMLDGLDRAQIAGVISALRAIADNVQR